MPDSVVTARTRRFHAADASHVGFPLRDEAVEQAGVGSGNVVVLAAVGGQIKQLPVSVGRPKLNRLGPERLPAAIGAANLRAAIRLFAKRGGTYLARGLATEQRQQRVGSFRT